jgi:hypothetical protein
MFDPNIVQNDLNYSMEGVYLSKLKVVKNLHKTVRTWHWALHTAQFESFMYKIVCIFS